MTFQDRRRQTWRDSLFALSFFLSAAPIATVAHGMPRPLPDFRILPAAGSEIAEDGASFAFRSLAGERSGGAVRVSNLRAAALRVSLYAADTDTASGGGVAITTRHGEEPVYAGAWIRLSRREVVLGPGESGRIGFELTVPESALPGEYTAAIVAEGPPRGSAGPFGSRLVPRAAVTVLIVVPGGEALTPELGITSLKPEAESRRQAVVASLSNLGGKNIAAAEGRLVIREVTGEIRRNLPVRLGYFLARDTLRYRIFVEPELGAGNYLLTLSLEYGGRTAEKTESLVLGEPAAIPGMRGNGDPVAATRPASGSSRLPVLVLGACVIVLLLARVVRQLPPS